MSRTTARADRCRYSGNSSGSGRSDCHFATTRSRTGHNTAGSAADRPTAADGRPADRHFAAAVGDRPDTPAGFEQVVGLVDLVHFLCARSVAGMEVGVVLLGKAAIGLLDLVLARAMRYAEHLIRITCHLSSPLTLLHSIYYIVYFMKIVNHLKTIRENKMKIPPKRTFGRGSLSKKIPDEWLRKGR